MNFKDWSAVLGTWVSISAAVFGGYLALQSYQADVKVRKADVDKRADARVVQTFELFEQFQSGEMMRIRNRMTESTNAGALAMLRGQQDFFAYVDFFDAVQICVDRQLCDAELTRQLFSPYAKGPFLSPMKAMIAETREAECDSAFGLDRPFGYGIETLATGTPPSAECARAASPAAKR